MFCKEFAKIEVKMSLENAAEWSKEKFDRELENGYADMLAGMELKEKYKV